MRKAKIHSTIVCVVISCHNTSFPENCKGFLASFLTTLCSILTFYYNFGTKCPTPPLSWIAKVRYVMLNIILKIFWIRTRFAGSTWFTLFKSMKSLILELGNILKMSAFYTRLMSTFQVHTYDGSSFVDWYETWYICSYKVLASVGT